MNTSVEASLIRPKVLHVTVVLISQPELFKALSLSSNQFLFTFEALVSYATGLKTCTPLYVVTEAVQ